MTEPYRIDGVDISHWQSGALDFARAKRAGVRWVYHKATEGTTYTDPRYAARRAEVAREGGLPFGAYHFARPDGNDALAEARHFLRVAKPKAGDMRPMLDLEDRAGLSRKALTAWVKTFVTEVERVTGEPPFIYTSFDLDEHFNCPLWTARYNNKNEPPRIPEPWKVYTVHQFSNGVYGVPKSVAGLGNVDLNTMNGDPARLTKVFRLDAPEPTKTVKQVAQEVLDGKWGNGDERVRRLRAAGFDAEAVQREVNALVAARPTMTLTVATANVKNFPDMSPAQVLADMKKVRRENPDLVLWQEIGEQEDFDAIIEAFGNTAYGNSDTYSGKRGRGYVGGNVITWLRSRLPMVRVTNEKIGPSMGPGTKAPSQWMVKAEFAPVSKDFPGVDAYCIHSIQGAFSRPGQPGDADGRRRAAWDSDYAALKKAVLASRKAGRIVIFGGDWNRRGSDIKKYAPDQKWIVAGTKGIDHVALLLPPGYVASTTGTKAVDLNSDHDLKLTRLTITKE